MGQPVALGQPEVRNLEQSGEEGAGQAWLAACRARWPGCRFRTFIIMSPQQCWGARSPSLAVQVPSQDRSSHVSCTPRPGRKARPAREEPSLTPTLTSWEGGGLSLGDREEGAED